MPRTGRAAVGGYCYHVLNRGNRRAEVFHDADDYAHFAALMRQACARVPMRVVGFCLMPNHFHLVLWPAGDDDLAAWMHWLQTTFVSHHNRRYQLSGHVWQGRFKAFPIAQDEHLLTVLRYVERNALRASLVGRAECWPWSSLRDRLQPPLQAFLDPGPVALPADWLGWVNEPQHEGELKRVRQSVRRGSPFGGEAWVRATASALGLGYTLRPRGRPLKACEPTPEAEPMSLFQVSANAHGE
jgi:putative transposase